ncbi:MAG: hypothetical protein HZB99_03275 [Candidatus Harrisonbacteria bacterium]|nr:hypothetical protein [Candidatus Harrisonbacteria bacterium]
MAFGIFTKFSVLPVLLQKIFLLQFPNIYTQHNFIILIESLVYIYASFLAGSFLLRKMGLDLNSRLKQAAYSVMSGYAIFGLWGLVLAASGLFEPMYLRMFLVLAVLGSAGTIAKQGMEIWKADYSKERITRFLKTIADSSLILKLLIALWIAANFAIVLVPITGHDTLHYHLPIMANLISEGRMNFDTALPSRFLPIFGEIIYAVPMAIFSNLTEPFVFQVMQYSFLILFAILIYEFLKPRISNQFLGLAAVLLLFSIMDFQREIMHGGYIDVLAFLFGSASTLLLIENCCEVNMRPREVMLSALMLGVALGVKYLALVFAAINFLFLLVMFWRQKVNYGVIARWLAGYGLIIFAVSGFWYLKNAIFFGSPIYPMFSNKLFTSQVNVFLLDRTVLNFFWFPFYRYGQWFVQDVETSSRLVVLGYFIAAYLLFAIFFFSKKLRCAETLLFVFVQLYLLFLFFMSHQYRFLLPSNIMLVPLLILFIDQVYQFLKTKLFENPYSIFVRASFWAMSIGFALLFLANTHYLYAKFSYATGVYDQDEYRSEIGGF